VTAAAPALATAAAADRRRSLAHRTKIALRCAATGASLAGAADVFMLIGFVLPRDVALRSATPNLIAILLYLGVAFVFGERILSRAFGRIEEWLVDGRPVTEQDRLFLIRHPLRISAVNLALWWGSLVVFFPLNFQYGLRRDLDICSTIAMGGLTTVMVTYLLVERILRPLNTLAFDGRAVTACNVPGVKSRIVLAWALGTGIPLIGVTMMAADHGSDPLSGSALVFLSIVGLVSGAMTILFAAKSVAEPVESVRAAMARVEDGDLDVRVRVYDGSQIGQLQAGFNAMVEGLRERRALQDLFGRQVGVDVARHALERGVQLGGEQVDAAILFVDVIGSTELAAARPPAEVVAALNEFFQVVVEVVDRTGGFVNKFEGDAALCVFGAPIPRDDAITCALTAARLLHERLQDVRGLSAGIGVSAGTVVAGNVGARERFEYTVIGDAVNEAARLTELAKGHRDRLLVAANALEAADPDEAQHWALDGEVTLRGRAKPTRLATLAPRKAPRKPPRPRERKARAAART
jgi:adenylate cyclase